MKHVHNWVAQWGAWVSALVLVLGLSACQGSRERGPVGTSQGAGTAVMPTPPSTAPTTNAPYADVLYAGNRITIVYSGIPNPPDAHVEQISNDGYISPPYLEKPVKAAGLTTGDLQKQLHALYVPEIFRNVTITVLNAERYFFVGGEVKNPGQKPYLSEMTVVKAIQAAGDFTEYANESSVQVVRTDGRTELVDVKSALRDPSKDRPIYPGDVIDVRRSLFK